MCWKSCSSCWSLHLLQEDFLSAPIHSPPLSGSLYRSFTSHYGDSRGAKETSNVYKTGCTGLPVATPATGGSSPLSSSCSAAMATSRGGTWVSSADGYGLASTVAACSGASTGSTSDSNPVSGYYSDSSYEFNFGSDPDEPESENSTTEQPLSGPATGLVITSTPLGDSSTGQTTNMWT
jgi:hypothetical protein